MIEPKDFISELERLQELESYEIMDTVTDEEYDYLTSIAAEICDTPISLVSLIDDKRQWFKSHHGLDVSETPKEYAFCAHAINEPNQLFQVEDSRKDERFHDNPIVTGDPNVVFYAGVPLVSENGYPLGTLCVIDHKPKKLTKNQERALESLSKQVLNLLKLRRNTILMERALKLVNEKNLELQKFAYIAAHDIKSPLNNISSILEIFQNQNKDKLDQKNNEIISMVMRSSRKLGDLVEGLLEHSRNSNAIFENKETFSITDLKDDIHSLLDENKSLTIEIQTVLTELKMNRVVIDQILINLITNSIKYSDKEKIIIKLFITEDKTKYSFCVQDNGPGISPKHHKKLFDLFETAAPVDKYGKSGNGIGLATVKGLVEALGGTITIKSELGEGAQFLFTLPK